MPDFSNGYDAIVEDFIRLRSQKTGVEVVHNWAKSFEPESEILDIGAGYGLPLTQILVDHRLSVCAIDASPKMVAAFRQKFPNIEVACEAAENSTFFNRKYDGILSVGLIFLLSPDAQRQLFLRMAKALKPGGRLLFSAPKETGAWQDVLSKRESYSLGETEYHHLLTASALQISGSYVDEGGSHYYAATKPA